MTEHMRSTFPFSPYLYPHNCIPPLSAKVQSSIMTNYLPPLALTGSPAGNIPGGYIIIIAAGNELSKELAKQARNRRKIGVKSG